MGAAIAGAAVMGHVAGVNAGRYALSQPKSRPLAVADQERIRETLYRPLQQEQGLKFHQFEDQVRTIVTGLIGYRRDEQRLREALRQLHGLREREAEMIAEDYHGVMRVNEARSIRAVAEAIAASAIERRESRGGGSHFRLDYPKKDDGHGLRIIEVEQLGDELQVSSHPTGIPSSVLPEAPATKEEW
jgi:succinate dehydrogenase/fumarate reductase flavoprotein subunit